MLKVGLTGNIGSGKSTVSKIFSTLGVPVYSADDESRKFLEEKTVIEQLVRLFGPKILNEKGTINKRELAGLVFTDATALADLNGILHPVVLHDFEIWYRNRIHQPYIIHEAAILFEAGVARLFDKIIHVSCPKEIAIARVVKRDGTDGNSVMERLNNQMTDEEKARLSDFIIVNDGTTLVIPQVIALHKTLSEIGSQRNDQVASGTADS